MNSDIYVPIYWGIMCTWWLQFSSTTVCANITLKFLFLVLYLSTFVHTEVVDFPRSIGGSSNLYAYILVTKHEIIKIEIAQLEEITYTARLCEGESVYQ